MNDFLIKPKTIKKSDILNKFFSLHPSEHKKIDISNTNLQPISQLVESEGVGEQIDVNEYLSFNSNHILVTISNMEKCIINDKQGENISPIVYGRSSKKLLLGDVLVSRNASLGKVTLVNKNLQAILNGGISYLRFKEEFKYYVFAFFLLNYGRDYLTVITSGGGTQKNAKRQNLLDLKIPFPHSRHHANPKSVESYVAMLTQNIIDKEENIALKQTALDNMVYDELKKNQTTEFTYSLPKKSELMSGKRLDTGIYTEKYKIEDNLIANYKYGYTTIDVEKFKSGSTPKVRIFNSTNSPYKWVTPTDISDEGFYNPKEKISMPTTNNINKDCVLFINRTSKGKKGEYVGITTFYDFSYYGKGHHNQGLYRLENLSKSEMLFLTAFMNSKIMRRICGNVSIGSKMKEMKSSDFATLKFPKFPQNFKNSLACLYFNEVDKIEFNINSYLIEEKNRNKKLGIYQLNIEILELKEKLNKIIENLLKNEPVTVF